MIANGNVMSRFWEALKQLASSKKFIMVIVGSITTLAAKKGFHADADTTYQIVSLFLAAIFGAAYVDGKANAAPTSINTLPAEVTTLTETQVTPPKHPGGPVESITTVTQTATPQEPTAPATAERRV